MRKKILDHDKYITTPEFNELTKKNFDERLKLANLATKSDLETVLQRANNNDKKIKKLQRFDLNYMLGKTFFGDDGFQNLFVINQHLVH